MRSIFFFDVVLIVLLITGSIYCSAQSSPAPLDICCVHYAKGMFRFSIVNNSDSIVKLTFEHIQRKNDIIILKAYKVEGDTLSVRLTENRELEPVSASGPLKYYIDGESYFQKTILPKSQLHLRIKNKDLHKRINYIRIIQPDGQFLIKRII